MVQEKRVSVITDTAPVQPQCPCHCYGYPALLDHLQKELFGKERRMDVLSTCRLLHKPSLIYPIDPCSNETKSIPGMQNDPRPPLHGIKPTQDVPRTASDWLCSHWRDAFIWLVSLLHLLKKGDPQLVPVLSRDEIRGFGAGEYR